MTPKNKGGRPSSYSEQIAKTICERISLGDTLRAICREDNFPDKMTVLRWLNKYPEFRAQYTQARVEQADTYAEMIIEEAFSSHDAQIGRLRVDALKWASSKLAPKKYGDRVDLELNGTQKLALTFNIGNRDDDTIDAEYAIVDREPKELYERTEPEED